MLNLIKVIVIIACCSFSELFADVVISTKECGTSKGCFRPSCGCSQNTCQYLVTYQLDASKEHVQFELSGQVVQGGTPYVTMGLGDTDTMDRIYTISCYWNGTAVVVEDGITLELPHRGHSFAHPPNVGVSDLQSEFNTRKSVISCRFLRARDPSGSKVAKDLRGNHSYYLFAASGKSVHMGSGLGNHHKSKWVTDEPVPLTKYQSICQEVSPSSSLLIKLHGSFMIAAWIAIGAIGIMLALHYRLTLAYTELLGSRTWLRLHRILQTAASLLTAAGFITVFIAAGELHIGDGIAAAHPIIGITAMSLIVVNIVLVLSRRLVSAENSQKKKMITLWHKLIGRCLFYLTTVNIVLGLLLYSPQVDDWSWPVFLVVVMIAVTVFVELVLYIHGHTSGRRNEASHGPTQDAETVPLLNSSQVCSTPPRNRFRMAVLFAYALAVAAVASALISGVFELLP